MMTVPSSDNNNACTALVVYNPNNTDPLDSLKSKAKEIYRLKRKMKTINESYESGEKVFVGLSNQGATCYMNSLLQTLYMTPEVLITKFILVIHSIILFPDYSFVEHFINGIIILKKYIRLIF